MVSPTAVPRLIDTAGVQELLGDSRPRRIFRQWLDRLERAGGFRGA